MGRFTGTIGNNRLYLMCEILEKFQNKGREEGRAEGRAEGGLEKAKEVTLTLNQMGMSKEEISRIAGVELEAVEQWLGEDQKIIE